MLEVKRRLDEFGASLTIVALGVFTLDTLGYHEPLTGHIADVLFFLLIAVLTASHAAARYVRRRETRSMRD